MNKNTFQKILDDYSLTLISFSLINGGSSNTSYLVETKQGHYTLTLFNEKSREDVLNLSQLLLLLADYNFPSTRSLCSNTGDKVTVYNNKPVLVKNYIAGFICEYLNTDMLEKVGRSLATLHQLPVPDYLPVQHPYGSQIFNRINDKNIDSNYETWLQVWAEDFRQNKITGLPRGLIHGDLFYDNIIFENKQFKAIIDFEEACFYYKIFDLGMAILGLCRESNKLLFFKAKALVKGYQQVQPLNMQEVKALQKFVEYAAVATSFWRFWKYNIDTSNTEKMHKHLEMVQFAIRVKAVPEKIFLDKVFD